MAPKTNNIKPNWALLKQQEPADYVPFMNDLQIKPQYQKEFFEGVIIYRIRQQGRDFNAGNVRGLADGVLRGYGQRFWSLKSRSYFVVGHPDQGQTSAKFQASRDDETRKSEEVALEKLNHNTEEGKQRLLQILNGIFKAIYETLMKDRLAEAQFTEEAEEIAGSGLEREANPVGNYKDNIMPLPGPHQYAQLIPGNNDAFNSRGPDGKLTQQAVRLCVLKCQEIIHFLNDNAQAGEYEKAFAALDEDFVNEDYIREPVKQAKVAARADKAGRVRSKDGDYVHNPREQPFQAISGRRVPALDYDSRLPIGLSKEPWLSQGDPTKMQYLAPTKIPRPKTINAWINVSPPGVGHRSFQVAAITEVPCGEKDIIGFFDSLLAKIRPKDEDVRGFAISYGWCDTMRYVANYDNAKKGFWADTFLPDIEHGVKCGVAVWRLTVLVITDFMWGGRG